MTSELSRQIEATRVARFKKLTAYDIAFVDSLLPEGRKKNLRVIGKGVVEDPTIRPPITEDHGFTISYIVIPPGGGAGLHAHKTAEIFIPMNGSLTVLLGEDKEELVLAPLDVISVPTGLMRGFRNHGDTELTILAMVGGHAGGGSVTWHDEVISRAARETGLGLDEQGNLTKLPNFTMPDDVQRSVI